MAREFQSTLNFKERAECRAMQNTSSKKKGKKTNERTWQRPCHPDRGYPKSDDPTSANSWSWGWRRARDPHWHWRRRSTGCWWLVPSPSIQVRIGADDPRLRPRQRSRPILSVIQISFFSSRCCIFAWASRDGQRSDKIKEPEGPFTDSDDLSEEVWECCRGLGTLRRSRSEARQIRRSGLISSRSF